MSSVRRPRTQREPAQSDVPLIPSAAAPQPEVLATNTGVRLACTMAAMLSPFALFLCWAEKESRVIRRFAVQSAALLAVHGAVGLVLLMAGLLCSGVPYLNFLMGLTCWLIYIAAAIGLLVVRIRLMRCAWQGIRMDLPLLERWLRKYD